jgi:putative membrane protein
MSRQTTRIKQLFRAHIGRPTAGIALVLLLAVPASYTGLLLWVNHDPYNNLSAIPAALVVEDTGVTVGGITQNYGDDVARTLTRAHKFDWHTVTAAEAAAGLRNGTYDFSIGLPAGFSATVASTVQNVSTASAQKATIVLTTNDATSYTATSIAKQAANAVAEALARRIRTGSATELLTQLAGVRSGLVTVVHGSATLSSALNGVTRGSEQLATGAAQLRTGANQLAAGLKTLKGSTEALPATAAKLAAGAQQVAVGSANAAAQGQHAAALAASLIGADSLALEKQKLLAELTTAGLTDAQIATVEANIEPVLAAATQANSQVQAISGQLNALSTGAAAVSGGMQQLSAQAPTLLTAIAATNSGAAALARGAQKLSDGSTRLAAATTKSGHAASTLHKALRTGLNKIPQSDKTSRAHRAATMANPVIVRTTALTAAGSLGAGLAPYFISLGAWIGVYSLLLVIRPARRRNGGAVGGGLDGLARLGLARGSFVRGSFLRGGLARGSLARRLAGGLPGWLAASILGSIQMVLVLATLNERVNLPGATLGFMILASVSFAAIMWALNLVLGRAGQYVAIGLMLVQLVTAGGTFPWQTLPAPLAVLHTALPMSAAVDGLRQLMYGGSLPLALTEARQLLLWLVGALLVVAIASLVKTRAGAIPKIVE